MSLKRTWTLSCALLILSIASTASLAAEKGRVAQPLGKTLDGWTLKGNSENSHWKIGIAQISADSPRELIVQPATEQSWELVNAEGHGVDVATEEEFGDCTVELEMMVPKGSNSGIYLMGQYEIQVLDSFGRERVGPGDLGGIYSAAPPKLNAVRAPGEWQQFVIEFQAPRFENGQKVANARFLRVTLNGQVIHEDVEVKGQTGGAWRSGEFATGPLMFQGNHGPVAYRSIKITSK